MRPARSLHHDGVMPSPFLEIMNVVAPAIALPEAEVTPLVMIT
jgi:hypothetical protein